MKKIGRILVATAIVFACSIFSIQAQGVRYTLLSSSSDAVTFRVDFPAYQTESVDVNGLTMNRLQMKNAYPLLNTGAPELLESAISLIIPEGAQPTAQVVASDFSMVSDFELAPSKGRLLRNVDPQTVAFVKGAPYFTNRFLLDDSVSLGEPYQLRDFHGVAVQVFPFAYNPVQKMLKVYSSITVQVNFNGTASVKRPAKVTSVFNDIYEDHFLNYQQYRTAALPENGDILVIAPDNFCAAMQPYADWKIKNGHHTEIVSLNVAGSTSSAIKSFISSYYGDHPNLDYVVMVGDAAQFPTITADGNISDNYYGEIVGSDKYADVIIGKISAEIEEHVNIQVNKFIQYEQNPPVTAHLSSFLGIASSQGPGDNNEYDYTHIRNIDNQLQNFTYTSGYELFEGNQGGLDASGSPNPAKVAEAVNNGVGIINYCGHGAETYWVTSNFSVTNINSLTNYNKLPFIFSVACVNGSYNGRTCFAEAWLRATRNDQPTGAVGALMSTINQPWNSPMCAQDAMNDALTGESNIERRYTYGGIAFSGIYKMLDNYNDYEVARTWILFGDPALQVRTATPQQLQLTYVAQLPFGTPNITFSSPVEGARVALSCHNQVIGTGTISNGSVTMDIPTNLDIMDTIVVLASAQNYIPFEGIFQLVPNDGPYLICSDITLQDNGNNDGFADYGETVNMNIAFRNVGNQSAENVHAVITTEDPYVVIVDNVLDIPMLATSAEQNYSNAFIFYVQPYVPAYHAANFHITLNYNDETYEINKNVVLHAPELSIGQFVVDDEQLGNGNHRLDLGESAYLVLDLHNLGNGATKDGMVYLYSQDQKLKLYRYPQEVETIAADGSRNVRFRVLVSSSVTAPTAAELRVRFKVGEYDVEKIISVKIGNISENWESGDFTTFNWINNSSIPWKITSSGAYQGNYAVRSGQIGNNASSILSITRNVAANDTISFYYKVSSEEGYDFLKFYIDNNVQDSWSGTINWTCAAYAVAPGMHTFKWEYVKDSYYSSGNDMAMIDNIDLPMVVSSTGIDDVANSTMMVYPNPTTQSTQLILDEKVAGRSLQYQLFELSGRMLQQADIVEMTSTIDLTGYADGIYLLKVVDDSGNMVQRFKIVKQ